jgi:transposase-like protein
MLGSMNPTPMPPGGGTGPVNMDEIPGDTWETPPADEPIGVPSSLPRTTAGRLFRRRAASVATMAGLAIGGIAGGVVISHAATSAPSPTGSPSAPAFGGPGGDFDHHGGPGHGAGRAEDLQVVAAAIGISAGDLQSALQSGQTIAAVAKAHNVDVNKVISALVASEGKEIDALVSSGRITQAMADQMKAGLQQRVTDMVNGVRPPGGPGMGRHGLQPEDLSLVAGAIGISAGDLQSALQSGQTIAAVAKAHGVDVNRVISAWVASENQEIDQRLSSGQITQSQADQMKSMTQQRITDMVDGTFRGGPRGDFHGGPGPGSGSTGTQSSGPIT